MCGIVAVTLRNDASISVISSLDTIRHRGPDDSGIFVSKRKDCYLAHARLSILDLSYSGHQPMPDATGRFVLSYNGEVYNYRDLQFDLESRYGPIQWKSGTDSEVIVEGVAREGISFLDRLNGFFSIAIYDVVDQVLHVLRDPIGIKPLFITEQKGGLFFCSELKGLLKFSFLDRSLRRDFLAEQLAFMYVPEPHTPFNEFKKVKPGICFTYQNGKLVSQKKLFQSLQKSDAIKTESEAIDKLQSTFEVAVKRQLVADVPVSLFLSGGLDSSAVAYHVAQSNSSVKTAYTITSSGHDNKKDAQGDDLYYAKKVAKNLDLNLEVISAEKSFLDLLPDIITYMEDGFSDPASINTFIISQAARNDGVKVMLSGQGADEYLGGYRRYLAEKTLENTPVALKRVISYLDHVLPANLPGKFNGLNRRVKRFSQLASESPNSRIMSMYTWSSNKTISSLLLNNNILQFEDDFHVRLSKFSGLDVVDKMMKIDRHYDLMSLNLCYTDRMSMAAGVEVRVPFLDFDLVKVMNSIPAHLKVKGRHGKYIFKKAMEPFLPKEIIYREKAGFGLPLRAWMNDSYDLLSHYLEPSRLLQQNLYNVDSISEIIKEQRNGVHDHSYLLFTLLTQQLWLESNQLN